MFTVAVILIDLGWGGGGICCPPPRFPENIKTQKKGTNLRKLKVKNKLSSVLISPGR
jgi:hypothetical protein